MAGLSDLRYGPDGQVVGRYRVRYRGPQGYPLFGIHFDERGEALVEGGPGLRTLVAAVGPDLEVEQVAEIESRVRSESEVLPRKLAPGEMLEAAPLAAGARVVDGGPARPPRHRSGR